MVPQQSPFPLKQTPLVHGVWFQRARRREKGLQYTGSTKGRWVGFIPGCCGTVQLRQGVLPVRQAQVKRAAAQKQHQRTMGVGLMLGCSWLSKVLSGSRASAPGAGKGGCSACSMQAQLRRCINRLSMATLHFAKGGTACMHAHAQDLEGTPHNFPESECLNAFREMQQQRSSAPRGSQLMMGMTFRPPALS
eukprot:1158050-Pelagomonas_calceolata.AAC.3